MTYIVGVTETCEVLGRFETEQEASEFIGTLSGHEDGRYYLDGPEAEANDSYQSPQGFSGKRMGQPGDGVSSGFSRGAGPSGKGSI